MGLIKSLGLFRTRKSPEQEVIPLQNFGSWFKNQREIIIKESNLAESSSNFSKKIADKGWYLTAQIEKWEEKIDNLPKDKRQELNLIFSQVRKLMDTVTSLTEPKLDKVIYVNTQLAQPLENLIKLLEKSFFIHDFSYILEEAEKTKRDVNPLFKELIEFSNLQKSFSNKVNYCKILTLDKIEEKAEKLQYLLHKYNHSSQKLDYKQSRLIAATSKKTEKDSLISNLKDNKMNASLGDSGDNWDDNSEEDDYSSDRKEDRSTIVNNKAETLIRQKRQLEDLKSTFGQIRLILRKYLELNPNKLLAEYVNDPIKALEKDEGLTIIHTLQHLKAVLAAGRFNFPLAQRDSTIKLLDELCTVKLAQCSAIHLKFKKELASFPVEISDQIKDPLLASKLQDIEYRREHFSKQIESLKEEVEQLDEEAAQIKDNILKEKDMLQKLVKVVLDKDILLSF